MQVKKFQGKTIPDAMNMVRKALGSDALILSTKRIESKNAEFGKEKFEIWAVPHDIYSEQQSVEVSSDYLDGMKTDLQRLNEILYTMAMDGGYIDKLSQNKDALDLYTKLIRTGMSKKYVNRFLEMSGAFEKGPLVKGKALKRRVLGEILKVIDVVEPFSGKQAKQKVAAFVGPTGVGKTTTIAKLAADTKLNRKKSVGLVSIDNYRMGAMEQLKSYAKILGVPCFPAFNGKDLKFALRRLKNMDVVLIDTAGQSQYDTKRMKELAGFVTSDRSITCHLLLSTTTNENEIESVTKNFGKLNIDSYVFTKIDETKTRGMIINQLIRSKVPASFVTTGQKVPEDLFKATKTGILSLMFQ